MKGATVNTPMRDRARQLVVRNALLLVVILGVLLACGLVSCLDQAHAQPLHPPRGYPAMGRAAIRVAVDSALDEDGVVGADRWKVHAIFAGEAVKNLAHPGGKRHHDGVNGLMWGIAQLNRAKARKCDWWNPHEATHMAVRYMRSRRYGHHGRGIAGAYANKRRHRWY